MEGCGEEENGRIVRSDFSTMMKTPYLISSGKVYSNLWSLMCVCSFKLIFYFQFTPSHHENTPI